MVGIEHDNLNLFDKSYHNICINSAFDIFA